MKNLFLSAALVAGTLAVSAQESYKPVTGTITTEVGLASSGKFTDLNDGLIRGRYFFSNDLAGRVGLNVGTSSTTKNTGGETTVSGVAPKNETKLTVSGIALNVGVEKHFAGTDKLSTYVGADLLISNNSNETTSTTTGSVSLGGNTVSLNNTTSSKSSGFGFGLRVVTGADYYITKKVYLGVEVGLGYEYTSTKNEALNSSSTGSDSGAFTRAIGGLKLGYQF